MVETKLIEVRDHMTCMIMLATRPGQYHPAPDTIRQPLLTPTHVEQRKRESWMWNRSGFGNDSSYTRNSVFLTDIDRGETQLDPYDWRNDRTRAAHIWIRDNFDKIPHTGLVDIRYLLGETTEPCTSDYVS